MLLLSQLINMILRYLTISVVQVTLMAFQWVFSFLIALSVTREGHLRFFPSRFEPIDSLAIGDEEYWNTEMAHTKNWTFWVRQYWLALNWGMRNPGYGYANLAGFDLYNPTQITFTGTSGIDVGWAGAVIGSSIATLINGDGKKYFEYRKIFRLTASRVFYIQLGWSISNLEAGRKHLCVYIRPFVQG